ncbi:MAG: hypothetical protein AAB534_00950 [Patescibacteria group bacterium]
MASKNSSSSLVSGLGMAMVFIQALVNEIVRLGGFEEMLHFLTSERGKDIVTKLAQVIVDSPWRVPRTLIEKLAREKSAKEYEDAAEYDSRFWWNILDLESTFKIPVIRFDPSCGSPPPPEKILDQLRGKEICYPLIVEWEGEPHVVVSIGHGYDMEVGVKHPDDFGLEYISLAPAKYFDLER